MVAVTQPARSPAARSKKDEMSFLKSAVPRVQVDVYHQHSDHLRQVHVHSKTNAVCKPSRAHIIFLFKQSRMGIL